MSLEIRSIGEVFSYQATPRTEFVVGMGVVKSKTSENILHSTLSNLSRLMPKIHVMSLCWFLQMLSNSTGLSQVYNVGSRIKVEGAAELHNNVIYCELQHATFVILKNTTSNDTNIAVSSPLPLLSEACKLRTSIPMKTYQTTLSLHQSNQTKRLNPGEQPYEI
ncbi:8129_t:CDS:2 [Paraglomus brasilianum]|uniref:8129_t:CDS:1 n=1 Tax=Paraglomus brasilianum TaxID=144538 RepID=A0A9N8ZID1_9GLOM|nr:8129_t:CDS:2 [Paraglomus brasilianum]